ncbi:MAG: hypothetical protein LJE83_04685 [Gammaproteobacteria bacterium]|nr:hypothetical protein [Gammaproteobacteria bacterium]
MDIRILFTISVFLMAQFAIAEQTVDQIRPDLDNVIQKLENSNSLPKLLPIIIDNKDFIGLTQTQVDELVEWQKTNKAAMVTAIRNIANKRNEMNQAALSAGVSSSRLIQMQKEIIRIQREITEYKLSCREHILRTFNDGNWINFFMVMADEDIGIMVPQNYADAQRLQHTNEF